MKKYFLINSLAMVWDPNTGLKVPVYGVKGHRLRGQRA